jgi:predicted XRE-type DNA-binding protein
MDGASQLGWDNMQLTNGKSTDEVYLRVKVANVFDVVTALIRQGGMKQAAIAEALEMGPDVFSKKFTNPGDCFYTALDQLDKMITITGQIAPVEYLAMKHGYRLTPIARPNVPTVDDADGGTGMRKP